MKRLEYIKILQTLKDEGYRFFPFNIFNLKHVNSFS